MFTLVTWITRVALTKHRQSGAHTQWVLASVLSEAAESSRGEQRRTAAALRRSREVAHPISLPGCDGGDANAQLQWLHKYVDDSRRVAGFFEVGLLDVYWQVHLWQRRTGVRGAVAEVGVFRGKSFLPLWALRGVSEAALAIDLFADQERNADRSGIGDRAAFEKALEAFGPPPVGASVGPTVVMQQDSTTLSPRDVTEAIGGQGIRLFSVDGSHTARATQHDLGLAEGALVPEGGVVILDDALNPDWPGVATGLGQYLVEGGNLRPFCLGYNKCLLAPAASHAELLAVARALPTCRKVAELWDSEVAILPQGWTTAFHGNDRTAEMTQEGPEAG